MILWHILLLLFAHTIADFVLQSREVAKGKSGSNYVLFKHVAIYTVGLCVVGPFLASPGPWMAFLAVNAVAHFATDWITSRLTTHFWKKEQYHHFFTTIGFDQFAHVCALLISYTVLLSP